MEYVLPTENVNVILDMLDQTVVYVLLDIMDLLVLLFVDIVRMDIVVPMDSVYVT